MYGTKNVTNLETLYSIQNELICNKYKYIIRNIFSLPHKEVSNNHNTGFFLLLYYFFSYKVTFGNMI